MVSKMGFEPTNTAFSGLRVCQLRHLDIVVGSAGVEPTSERGDRVQGYSLLPLPLGQLPKHNKLSKIDQRIGGEPATRTLVSQRAHWFSGPVGLPAAHALRGELPIK